MGFRSGDTHINRELRSIEFLKVSRYNPVSVHMKEKWTNNAKKLYPNGRNFDYICIFSSKRSTIS